jgi:hypothetical protein
MPTQEATPTEQVFVSKSTNLSVTRFGALTDIQNGLQRKLSPGLRYEFGRESSVVDSQGFSILEGGAVRVTDELRKRDRQYIVEYGHLYGAEKDVDPGEKDTLRGPHQVERFLSTEDFLRRRAEETGAFQEVPPVAPDSNPVLRRITDLVIEDDIDGLLQLHEDETDGWQRPDVLEAAESALNRLVEKRELEQPPAA